MGDRIVEETLEAVRRGAIGLDLIALPVEGGAAVVVGVYVDEKGEHISMQCAVIYFADMSPEVGVGTVRDLFCGAPEHAIDQFIGVARTVGGKDCAMPGAQVFFQEGEKFAARKRGYDQDYRQEPEEELWSHN